MKQRSIAVTALLLVFVIEGLLALRLWTQVTGRSMSGSGLIKLDFLTEALIEPFRFITGTDPVSGTRVIDYTLLVAIEGYFVAILGLLALIWGVGRFASWLSANRHLPVPHFVIAQRNGENTRPLLERVTLTRNGACFYVKVTRGRRASILTGRD